MTGTVSDFDGRYSITAKATDTLEISYLGYTTVTVPIQNRTTINIVLQEDPTSLGEVQINAGYYTTTDREKTGSIARITANEIEGQPIVNPIQALQGRMAGVNVVQNSGVPGSGTILAIRGQNSIAAGNAPLYIVDGVPYDTNSLGFKSLSGSILPGGDISPLNTLDPNAIASIEVLKDADATAIYGSRGANGVILITTKMGISGKTTVNLKTYTGVGKITKFQKLLNTEQYLQMREEAFANDGLTAYPYNAHDINGTWDRNRYTDWQKEFLGGTAIYNSHQLSVRGGNENIRFALGGSVMKESTVFSADYAYKKTNVFSTLDHTSHNDKFHVQFAASYGRDSNQLPGSDLTSISKNLAPNAPALYDGEGNLNWENGTWSNPYANLQKNYTNTSNNLIANTALSYKILKGISIKTNLGYAHSILEETVTNPHTVYNSAYGFDSSMSSTFKNGNERSSYIIEPQFDVHYPLKRDRLNIAVGGTLQEKSGYQLVLEGSGYPNNLFINNLNAANRVHVTSESSSTYRYMAFYGRLNYNVNQRYIFNLTGRHDGSSRFGPGNRFASFGAIGAAWVLSEENALKKYKWLDFAKIRSSYGTSGNDQIGDHQYLNTYSVSGVDYGATLGLLPTRLYNPNFAWEVNKKFEVALESSFLDSAIRMELAFYKNSSGNQLMGIPLPGTTGFPSVQSNLNATVENTGLELTLNTQNMNREDFTWHTSFNITVPKNRLTAFDGLDTSTYANQLVVGQPITVLKLYHFKGVDPQTGTFTFEDYNADGAIDAPGDRQFLVDLSPKFFGGLSNTVRYKNWNLDVLFQFVKKEGYNEFHTRTQPAGALSNQPVSVLDHWQQQGDRTPYQQYTTGSNYAANFAYSRFSTSSGIISDASFIRLKMLSLSYSIPRQLAGIDTMAISLQGYNLFTFTKFKGGDPEQIASFLPPLTKISLGLDITF